MANALKTDLDMIIIVIKSRLILDRISMRQQAIIKLLKCKFQVNICTTWYNAYATQFKICPVDFVKNKKEFEEFQCV